MTKDLIPNLIKNTIKSVINSSKEVTARGDINGRLKLGNWWVALPQRGPKFFAVKASSGRVPSKDGPREIKVSRSQP